jgi:hypothetical protein
VLADTINKEVEEGSPTLLGCKILKLDDKEETMADSNEGVEDIKLTTPRLEWVPMMWVANLHKQVLLNMFDI